MSSDGSPGTGGSNRASVMYLRVEGTKTFQFSPAVANQFVVSHYVLIMRTLPSFPFSSLVWLERIKRRPLEFRGFSSLLCYNPPPEESLSSLLLLLLVDISFMFVMFLR